METALLAVLWIIAALLAIGLFDYIVLAVAVVLGLVWLIASIVIDGIKWVLLLPSKFLKWLRQKRPEPRNIRQADDDDCAGYPWE